MIVNGIAFSLNRQRKPCLTFGLRSIIQSEHQAEKGKGKEIRLIKYINDENNYILLTYNLYFSRIHHSRNRSRYSSFHRLRHKAFSAICEKRRIFVFTLLMNANGTVFCSYRTKRE